MPYWSTESDNDDEPVLDDGGFALDIDMGLLEDAVAAVEFREAQANMQSELDGAGSIDLDELASVEAELAVEIEFEEDALSADDDPLGLNQSAKVDTEVRIRAIEAETERDQLRDKMDDLSRVKSDIEAKLQRLQDKASRARASSQNAMEAQQVAEGRAKRLREALQKQQKDVDRLLKRRKQEQQDQYERGRADAVLTLVEVLDNLVLAMGQAKSNPEQMVEGVRMVVQQFEGNLKRLGVETVPSTRGQSFDPNVHEAIANENDSELSPGQIVSTVSRGYTIDGKLLRAARVCVASEGTED